MKTTVTRKLPRGLLVACGVAWGGLVLSFPALAAVPASSLQAATGAGEQRLVRFFFSDEAWGGVPFSEADKQKAMVDAMLSSEPVRLEAEVTHLPSAPDVRVRSFVAVFEVDGSVRPPTMRSGYELELLVPPSRETLSVELVNGETGVVNLVRVEPEGAP